MSARPYHSPLRQEQSAITHRRILEAARRLFTAQGYRATTIAQIAREANVVPQTIYNSIGGKSAVLLALNELVDEVARVRPIQEQIAQSEDPLEILALTVELRRRLMEGTGDIVNVLMSAASAEPDVAKAWADGLARTRGGTRRIVERLAALDALRADLDVDAAADSLYAMLHHSIWVQLVEVCGWTPDQFAAWCLDLLSRMLLREPDGEAPAASST